MPPKSPKISCNGSFNHRIKVRNSVIIEGRYKKNRDSKSDRQAQTVVGREIRRNKHELGQYNALLAHDNACKKELAKPKHRKFTDEVKAYVSKLLQDDFSSEQITGIAKNQGVECLSHVTIYQFVWNDKWDKGTLYKHLRNKGRRY